MTTYNHEWLSGVAVADPWSSAHVTAERKYDGWRAVLHYGDRHAPRLYSRTGREIGARLGGILPSVAPGLTVLDCELVAGSGADDVAGVVARGGEARLVAFDILVHRGRDVRALPFSERRALRDAVVREDGGPSLSVVEYADRDKSGFYASVLADGGEGVVLKDLRSRYGHGLQKAKRVETVDAIVTGWDAGTGSLVLSVWRFGRLAEVARIPHERIAIGTVVEVAAQGWTANGRLRHARLVRFRQDKPALACRAA